MPQLSSQEVPRSMMIGSFIIIIDIRDKIVKTFMEALLYML